MAVMCRQCAFHNSCAVGVVKALDFENYERAFNLVRDRQVGDESVAGEPGDVAGEGSQLRIRIATLQSSDEHRLSWSPSAITRLPLQGTIRRSTSRSLHCHSSASGDPYGPGHGRLGDIAGFRVATVAVDSLGEG